MIQQDDEIAAMPRQTADDRLWLIDDEQKANCQICVRCRYSAKWKNPGAHFHIPSPFLSLKFRLDNQIAKTTASDPINCLSVRQVTSVRLANYSVTTAKRLA